MNKVIIGIHGLKNKPPKAQLEKWWKMSIEEGLQNIGYSDIDFKFELVYWAKYNYSTPLNPRITDSTDPLFLKEPYCSSYKDKNSQKHIRLKEKMLDEIDEVFDKVFLNDRSFKQFDQIVDILIRHLFKDLYTYYYGACREYPNMIAKTTFRNELANILRKYQNKKILLIAHSMGSIIAYDVLTQVIPNFNIDTFITIGSPLSVPIIIKKILEEQKRKIHNKAKLPTPENILNAWFNCSDINDKVATYYKLGDDYIENSLGIKPKDIIVYNDYECYGEKIHHNVYGYLRTPGVAKIIYGFLTKKNYFIEKISKKIESIISK